MPIPNLQNEVPINQYTASNGQTEFSFTFYIFATSDIKVYVNDVLKTITTDYVVRKSDGGAIGSSDLPLDGGKIIFNVGLSSGAKVSLNRDIPVERSTQFTTGGGFFADNLNTELTRILAIQQQITRDISRSFRLAPSDAEGGSLQLPTNRADNILAFDASGNLILYKLADIDKASVSPYIATLLNDVDANEARTTLGAQQLNSNLTSLSALASISNLSALSGLASIVNLSALAALTGSSKKIPYFTGAGTMGLMDFEMPVGSIIACARNTAPSGFLECSGAELSRTTYSNLFSEIGTTFGSGNGSTTFNIPNLRGEFIRGWDNGRGIDSGRSFGSAQLDSIQNITGSSTVSNGWGLFGNSDSPSGVFAKGTWRSQVIQNVTATGYDLTFDASRVARTSTETRGRNIALMYCIKY